MSVLDAAIQVLEEADNPLHAKEITERILSKGFWKTSGKTPAATVSARLYSDIKKKGKNSHFILHAPQTFGLRTLEFPDKAAGDAQPEDTSLKAIQTQTKTYSFTDSAEKVLEKFGNKRPMHYRAITEKALELGWLVSEGKTPEASMYAQILTEIKRFNRRGEQPRFVQHGKGYVGLSKWMGRGLAFEIEQHNKKVRQALHKRLFETEWDAFEELIARLLAEMGFEEIEVTSRSKDGGIDVRGTLGVGDVIRTRIAIQVKKWKRNVQAPVVQQVRGSLGTHEQGLIITTSDFSAGARKEAARPNATPVGLMSGEQLVLLLIENGIGVSRRSYDLFELEDLSSAEVGTNASAPICQSDNVER